MTLPTLLGPALFLPQHPDEHRPQRPVLLAVDQQLGEGAAVSRSLAPSAGHSPGHTSRSLAPGEADQPRILPREDGPTGPGGSRPAGEPPRRARVGRTSTVDDVLTRHWP